MLHAYTAARVKRGTAQVNRVCYALAVDLPASPQATEPIRIREEPRP